MPWSFDELNPFALPKDHVRVLIGDTIGETDESPSDEIITGLFVLHGNSINRVALESAKYMRAALKQKPQSRTAVGMTSVRSLTELDKLIKDLEAKVRASTYGGLETFGISRSDVREVESDPDFCPPFAGVGRNRNT